MVTKRKKHSKNRLLLAAMIVFVAFCSFKIVGTQMEVSEKQYQLQQLEQSWKTSWKRERPTRPRSLAKPLMSSTGMAIRTSTSTLTARQAKTAGNGLTKRLRRTQETLCS